MQTMHDNNDADSGVMKNEDGAPEIRITGINTDKTRKIAGSETTYHVYFTLSKSPTGAWRDAFAEEWNSLAAMKPQLRHAASIDGGFLFVECSLGQVADIVLPALRQAVVAANKSNQKYVQKEAREQTRKDAVWKDEREAVEDMARSLHFE